MMQRLVASHKKEKGVVFRTARHLALNDEPTKAIELLDKYLSQVDSNDVDVLLLKGHILDTISKFDQAKRLYERVLRIDSDNAPALIDLGDYYSDCKHDYKKALRYYSRALRLVESGRYHLDAEDEFIEACTEKSEMLLELNRPMEALRCIVHGLQKHPADIVLGGALQRAQERYDAIRDRKFSKRYHTLKKQIAKLR